MISKARATAQATSGKMREPSACSVSEMNMAAPSAPYAASCGRNVRFG